MKVGRHGRDTDGSRVVCVAPPTVAEWVESRLGERSTVTDVRVCPPAAVTDSGRAATGFDTADCLVVGGDDALATLEALPAASGGATVVVTDDGAVADAAFDAGADDVVWRQPGGDGDLLDRRVDEAIDRHVREAYRDLLHPVDHGVVVHHPETGDVLATNDRLAELLGYDPDAVDDLSLADITAGTDGYTEALARENVRAAAGEGPQSFEWLDETSDGDEQWVEVGLSPTSVAGRERVVATVRDVTERRARELALEEREELEASRAELEASEARLRRVLSRVEDEVFAVDDDWTVTFTNREATDFLDGRTDDPVGDRLWDVLPSEAAAEFRPHLERAMADQTGVDVERVEVGDRWFAFRAYPSTDGLSIYLRDVTERERHERERRIKSRAMDKASIPLTLADPDRLDVPLVYVNDAFEELTGYGPGDAVGRNCRFLQGEDTDPEAVAELRAATDAEESASVTLKNYTADGDPFWNQVEVVPIRDEDGDVLRLLGTQRDVTEEVRHRETLTALLAEIDELHAAATKETVAETVIEAVDDVLDYSSCSVRLYDPDADALVPVATTEETLTNVERDSLPVVDPGEGITGTAYVEDEPYTLAEYADGMTYDPDEVAIGSAYVLPLGDHGVLNVGSSEPDAFDAADRQIAEILATNATAALDRAEREGALREYETLVESAEEMLYVLDEEYCFSFVSEALADFLGYDREELIGERGRTVMDESSTGLAHERAGEVLSTSDRSTARFEGRLVDRDGEGYPAEFEFTVLPHNEGFDGLVGSVRHTAEREAARAEREAAKEELADSRRRVQKVFENANDAIFIVDPERDAFVDVNPAACEMLGYGREELLDDVTPSDVHPEEWERFVDFTDRVREKGGGWTDELTCTTADGGVVPAEISASTIDLDGETYVLANVRNVSERRRRERELRVFRQAVDSAGVGQVMYDESGRLTYLNDHFASLVGGERETLGDSSVWRLDPEWTPATFEAYWDGFDEGETRRREHRLQRADGTTLAVESVTTAVTIEGTAYHVVTVEEVTERRERRQQAAVLHRILRHNLRNDLTVIIAYADMLERTLDDESAEQAASLAEKARELADLADTAKSVERMLERDTVRKPTEVIEMIEAEVETLTRREAVDVETDLPDEQYVVAGPLLQRALSHLLENSVEHTDRDVPSVEVRVTETTGRAGWVDVVVADDGPGIPENERAPLTAGEETALSHGSGMGLWVVHWLVTRYGGDLRFEDRDPRGSRVVVSLPVGTTADGTTADGTTELGEGVGTVSGHDTTADERSTADDGSAASPD